MASKKNTKNNRLNRQKASVAARSATVARIASDKPVKVGDLALKPFQMKALHSLSGSIDRLGVAALKTFIGKTVTLSAIVQEKLSKHQVIYVTRPFPMVTEGAEQRLNSLKSIAADRISSFTPQRWSTGKRAGHVLVVTANDLIGARKKHDLEDWMSTGDAPLAFVIDDVTSRTAQLADFIDRCEAMLGYAPVIVEASTEEPRIVTHERFLARLSVKSFEGVHRAERGDDFIDTQLMASLPHTDDVWTEDSDVRDMTLHARYYVPGTDFEWYATSKYTRDDGALIVAGYGLVFAREWGLDLGIASVENMSAPQPDGSRLLVERDFSWKPMTAREAGMATWHDDSFVYDNIGGALPTNVTTHFDAPARLQHRAEVNEAVVDALVAPMFSVSVITDDPAFAAA